MWSLWLANLSNLDTVTRSGTTVEEMWLTIRMQYSPANYQDQRPTVELPCRMCNAHVL